MARWGPGKSSKPRRLLAGLLVLIEGPRFSMAWVAGLVEVEMAWQHPRTLVVSGQRAGPEDSPLSPGFTCPVLSCYPRAESHALSENTFHPPLASPLLLNPMLPTALAGAYCYRTSHASGMCSVNHGGPRFESCLCLLPPG